MVAPAFTFVPSNTGFAEGVTVIIRSASSIQSSESLAGMIFAPYLASPFCISSANALYLSSFRSKIFTSSNFLAASIASS